MIVMATRVREALPALRNGEVPEPGFPHLQPTALIEEHSLSAESSRAVASQPSDGLCDPHASRGICSVGLDEIRSRKIDADSARGEFQGQGPGPDRRLRSMER